MNAAGGPYRAAGYARLSREDGDKPESDSIVNQQRMIEDYCAVHKDIVLVELYADDGFTGTNFERPSFRRMIRDMEVGMIDCVIVKDLSRFGRDYIDVGYYLERYFPARRIRFIAVSDQVDSLDGPYDMSLPLKNVFNTQYAKDISEKVRSAFRTKQRRGEFVGAFAAYGYRKDPGAHGHLIVDPAASFVVRRIFSMAAGGIGQLKIAKILNEEHIPCPSEYKRMMGERYRNSHKLESTCYWTYATIHRMLQNPLYIGQMVSNRSVRAGMHGKAVLAPKGDWIIVENTHEPIISRELWDVVQTQLSKRTRTIDFAGNVSLFAGFLTCGDCGRAMCKTTWNSRVTYSCGSYHRYGVSVCSSHYIRQEVLEELILGDLNRLIHSVGNLAKLTQHVGAKAAGLRGETELQRLDNAAKRLHGLKKSVYEDYRDGLLTREEYRSYKEDYDRQERSLVQQRKSMNEQSPEEDTGGVWVQELVRQGRLSSLDRITLSQTVRSIRIFENRPPEITYLFSETLRPLLETHVPES